MRDNFIKAAARLQASGLGTAVRLTRVITSDKRVLCVLWAGGAVLSGADEKAVPPSGQAAVKREKRRGPVPQMRAAEPSPGGRDAPDEK